MGAVRAQRELELDTELVGGHPVGIEHASVLTEAAVGVVGHAILSANLAELGGPVSQDERAAAIGKRIEVLPVGIVIAGANCPEAGELVVGGDVVAEGALKTGDWGREPTRAKLPGKEVTRPGIGLV